MEDLLSGVELAGFSRDLWGQRRRRRDVENTGAETNPADSERQQVGACCMKGSAGF